MHRAPECGAIANILRADLEALLARCEDRHLYRSLAGSLGAWAVLAMVLADGTPAEVDAEALAWVREQYRVALARAERRIDLRPEVAGLRIAERVAGYATAIGDIEQTLPGADYELDPMLRVDESTAAVPSAAFTAPAGVFEHVEVPRPAPRATNGNAERVLAPAKGNGTPSERSAPAPVASASSPPRRIPQRRPSGGISASAQSRPAPTPLPVAPQAPKPAPSAAPICDLDDIANTLAEWFSRSANLPRSIVTPDAPLAELGLDSLTASELSALIEEHYNVRLQPTILWDCPNLRAVATCVAQQR